MIGHLIVAALSVTVLAVPVAAEPTPPTLKPVWTSGLPGLDSFDAIVAPDKKNAWAFGEHSADYRGRPLIYRKSGGTWKPVKLPAGLRGGIVAASASSATNVWAVGDDHLADRETYLLHWNGKRWKLVRRWDARRVLSVVATGRQGVWVFDEIKPRALRFDGSRWRAYKTPEPLWGAAAKGKVVWGTGPGGAGVMRFDGRRWKAVDVHRLLPKATKKSATLFSAPALVGKDVWLTGSHFTDISAFKYGSSFLLHRKNGKWRKEKPHPTLDLGFSDPIPDGRGGFWLLTAKEAASGNPDDNGPMVLVHRSASGRWSDRLLGVLTGDFPSVQAVVRVPGTQRFLAAGHADESVNSGDAAIYAFG